MTMKYISSLYKMYAFLECIKNLSSWKVILHEHSKFCTYIPTSPEGVSITFANQLYLSNVHMKMLVLTQNCCFGTKSKIF